MPKVVKAKFNTNQVKSESVYSPSNEPVAPRPCDRCRKHRIRCDRNQDQCHHCKKKGIDCTYLDIPKKRGPKPKAQSGDDNSASTATSDCSSDSILESQANSPTFETDEEYNSSLNSPNLSDCVGANESSYNQGILSQPPNQVDQFNMCYTAHPSDVPSVYIDELHPSMTYPENIYKNQELYWTQPIYNQYPLPFDVAQCYPFYTPSGYMQLTSDIWLTFPHINFQQSSDNCGQSNLSPLLF